MTCLEFCLQLTGLRSVQHVRDKQISSPNPHTGVSRFPGPEEPLPDDEVESQSFPAFAMRGASWRKGSRQVVSSASASSCIISTTRPGTKRHRTSSNALRCSTTGRDGTRRWATSHRCSFWRLGVWLNTMKTWYHKTPPVGRRKTEGSSP